MKTVCKKDLCNGCMACIDKCPKNAITINQNPFAYNSIIDDDKCIDCNICHNICPRNDEHLELNKPVSWYQGWANNEKIRLRSASGGAATAIIKAFLASKGYVCSCTFIEGEFRYKITNLMKDSECFAGSKYVKSNPKGVYRQIHALLKNGEKVLFIGLPCHVAAIKKYVGLKNMNELYTIDLICHGTPAPAVLEKYLNEHRVSIHKIKNISFRTKNGFGFPENVQPITSPGITDGYLFSFLKRINYTTNCYNCQFSSLQRISDLTIGDSWGSDLSADEQKKGISLFLVQNEKGFDLIKKTDLTLFPVNIEKAVLENAQLQNCSKMPPERDAFFKLFDNGVQYEKILFKIFPKVFIKQFVKKILTKLHFISIKDGVTYNLCVNKKND